MSPHPIDRESLSRDCDVEFVRASGPGGQHRNRRETGVRLTHRPTGVVIFSTERRSQAQNLDAAFARMAARLERLNRPRKRRAPTVVPDAERRRRLQAKRLRSEQKARRAGPANEGE